MGRSQHSRKGKKSWRKNIDTEEVQEFIKEDAHQQRRGPHVQALKDVELFFIDKDADDSAVPKSVVRKRQREAKPLRSQLIIESIGAGVQPVPISVAPRPKGALPAPRQKQLEQQLQLQSAPAIKRQRRSRAGVPLTDVWGDDVARPSSWVPERPAPALRRRKCQEPTPRSVAVDAPGCSFNPDAELHQDALAEVVAAEYKKQLKQEMAPKPPPLLAPEGFVRGDELAELQVDEEPDDEEPAACAATTAAAAGPVAVADPNAIDLDEDDRPAACSTARDGGRHAVLSSNAPRVAAAMGAPAGTAAGNAAAKAAVAASKKTRADRNRELRLKAVEREAAARAALKRQRKELDALQELERELADAEEEAQRRQKRREVVQQEKATSRPPRLGKLRYEEDAPPVLTSDEITGSLRQLTPCFLVAKDRFKALQRRGLVEPRRPAPTRKGKRVEYVGGDRTDKALESQEELLALRQKRAMMQRQAKAGKAAPGKAAAAQNALDVLAW